MRSSPCGRYIVQAAAVPSKKQLQTMAEGTMVDGLLVTPLTVALLETGPQLDGRRILVEVTLFCSYFLSAIPVLLSSPRVELSCRSFIAGAFAPEPFRVTAERFERSCRAIFAGAFVLLEQSPSVLSEVEVSCRAVSPILFLAGSHAAFIPIWRHTRGTNRIMFVRQVADGRHHEVRELAKAADVEVVALKRTRIGGLRLPRDLL